MPGEKNQSENTEEGIRLVTKAGVKEKSLTESKSIEKLMKLLWKNKNP